LNLTCVYCCQKHCVQISKQVDGNWNWNMETVFFSWRVCNCLPFRSSLVRPCLFTCLSGVRAVHVINLHVLVQCCDVRSDFRVKRCLICLNSHLSCRDSCFIYAICIFYVYWCPTRFPYQIMFASLNSNTTDVTCGAELLTKIL
jgi:hypothetical protein